MRTYLVIVDETAEATVALRFAARRAAKTGGQVQLLAIVQPVEFVGLVDVQATLEAESRERAEALVARATQTLDDEAGRHPPGLVLAGEPVPVIRQVMADNPDIAALVLGAAASGAPGPLIAYFVGAEAGQMPCPIMVIPGALDSAALDRMS